MDEVISRLDTMENGRLDIRNLNLTDISFMKNHPKYNEIKMIDCSDNYLTDMPFFPNVIDIYCYNNRLTQLPRFHNASRILCFDNKLKSLPHFPKSVHISCTNNELTSISCSPNTRYLYCDMNPLTRIPYIPHIENDCFHMNREVREKHNKSTLLRYLRKFVLKLHAKKWRNVNAEIACRPNTGIEWFKFKELIETL
jgi:hypothetical protein